MSRWKLPSGQIVQDNTSFAIDLPITIPAVMNGAEVVEPERVESHSIAFSGVRGLSPEQRTDFGIVEIVEQPRPDDRYGFVSEDPANPGAWIVAPFPAEMLKDRLIAYAKDKRWQKEVGGIEVNGVTIATDDRSQLKVAGARMAADADQNWTTDWDAGEVSVPIDAPTMVAISDAVQSHVNGVFTAFKDVRNGINAGTISTYEQIDNAFSTGGLGN